MGVGAVVVVVVVVLPVLPVLVWPFVEVAPVALWWWPPVVAAAVCAVVTSGRALVMTVTGFGDCGQEADRECRG